jgi:asparagine synthase (glutamine-hydrolysing)
VLARPKQGFSSALPYMLRDEYRLLFKLFLQDSQLVQAGVFDLSFIQRMLGEHLSNKRDHGSRLWLLLNSEVWYRMFIQGVTVSELTDQISPASFRTA